jgi:hypothetical protein
MMPENTITKYKVHHKIKNAAVSKVRGAAESLPSLESSPIYTLKYYVQKREAGIGGEFLGLCSRLRLQVHGASEAQLEVLVEGLAAERHALQEHVDVHQAQGLAVHREALLRRLDLHLVARGHVTQPQGDVLSAPSARICKTRDEQNVRCGSCLRHKRVARNADATCT